MEGGETKYSGRNPYKSWDEPLFCNEPQNSGNNEKAAEEKNHHSQKITDSPKRAIEEPKTKWWKQPEHIIASLMLFVNMVLAYYTYHLYSAAVTQSDAAVGALDQAKRANDLAQESAIQSAIDSKQQFDLQKDYLQTQIDALNSSKGNFIKQNESWLDFKVNNIDIDLNDNSKKTYVLIAEIKNLKNNPAKIISHEITICPLKSGCKNPIKLKPTTELSSKNVVSQNPIKITCIIHFNEPVPIGTDQNPPVFYIKGSVKYIDNVTTNKREFRFKARVQNRPYEGRLDNEFIYSDNINITDTLK